MILSSQEIQELTIKFLSEHSHQLEYITYRFDEVMYREGAKGSKIFIVKEGVFRVGRLDASNTDMTIAFAFKNQVLVPIGICIPEFPSLFSITSIENSLCKANLLYEISIEQ
jgi:CRP-like cAMP-binding protein